jgi:hypothetical protein
MHQARRLLPGQRPEGGEQAMIPLVLTTIICVTVLLLGGIWKADRTEQRALVERMSTASAAELARADIRRSAN